MGDAQTRLGLSCPREGKFYICDNANIRFIGCCTVDPCTEERGGECPTDDLRPASFSSDVYNQIGQQSCFMPEDEGLWYTCKAMADNLTPFMGCCKSNPCSPDGCATEDLFPARLSDNPDKAQVFLASGSTPEPSSTPDSSDEGSLPTSTIIGIAVGGAAFVCILVAVLMYWRKSAARKRKRSGREADEAAKLYSPSYPGVYSPGQSPGLSPGLSSNWPGSQPGSPGMNYTPYSSQHLSSAPSDWNPNSGHVSQMSGMSWDAVAANIHQKHYTQVPQGPPHASELDGAVAASPPLPPEPTQQRMELEAPEHPRTLAELPEAERR